MKGLLGTGFLKFLVEALSNKLKLGVGGGIFEVSPNTPFLDNGLGVPGALSKVYCSFFVLIDGAPVKDAAWGTSGCLEYGKRGKTAVTLLALAVLQAAIMINNSMKLSLTFPHPDWTMKTSFSRTESWISILVSPLENFLEITSPCSIVKLRHINLVRLGCDDPPSTTKSLIVVSGLSSGDINLFFDEFKNVSERGNQFNFIQRMILHHLS
jgi:hypothetical protein